MQKKNILERNLFKVLDMIQNPSRKNMYKKENKKMSSGIKTIVVTGRDLTTECDMDIPPIGRLQIDNVDKWIAYTEFANRLTFEVPRIEKVIFNDPATIVFWSDKTKTVVHCGKDEFDKEKGLAMAISKKALGNKGNYFETFKKFINED